MERIVNLQSILMQLLNEAATRRQKISNRCILELLPNSGHLLKRSVHHEPNREEPI
jgi:hypothetical protein